MIARSLPILRRVAFAAPFALAAAVLFQAIGAMLAVIATKSSSFGAPLAAGSLNLATGQRMTADVSSAAIDVVLTTLVMLAPAYRSAAILALAAVIGTILYGVLVFALSNATLPVTHVAWWIIAMLPSLVLGLLPRFA